MSAWSRVELPTEARLWLYDPNGEVIQGPYTAADRTPDGQIWTAIVPGDELVLEVDLPPGATDFDLLVGRVNHGYRSFDPAEKQGACQNDVVCPEGAPWQRQIRSVAWYTLEGIGTCTGSLVNNTARDGKPYFLSAEHCGVTRNNASSMVVYWNYESPSCGRLSGGRLNDNQSGATFRAAYVPSDFVLVELNRKPQASFDAYYAGWNAINQAPTEAVGIHHPNLDEKSISFSNRRLQPDGPTHWEIVWDDGTTEPGSSGSCIFDKDGLCVGTLTGGFSFCSDPQAPDYYGRFSTHWTGGGTAASSLKPWLDPQNTGQRTLAGMEPGGGGGGGTGGGGGGGGGTGGGGGGGGGTGGGQPCVANNTTLCLADGRFAVTVNWRDFQNQSGAARAALDTPDSGLFYFFDRNNWEVMVKVLDGCGLNQRFWVFAAATTNLEYTLRVEDTETGQFKTWRNPLGSPAPAVTDSGAFNTCP